MFLSIFHALNKIADVCRNGGDVYCNLQNIVIKHCNFLLFVKHREGIYSILVETVEKHLEPYLVENFYKDKRLVFYQNKNVLYMYI